MSDKIFVEKSEFVDLDMTNILAGSNLVGKPVKVSLSSGRSYVVGESDSIECFTVSDLSKESRDLGFNLENISQDDLEIEYALCEKSALTMFRDREFPYRTQEEYNQYIKDLNSLINICNKNSLEET